MAANAPPPLRRSLVLVCSALDSWAAFRIVGNFFCTVLTTLGNEIKKLLTESCDREICKRGLLLEGWNTTGMTTGIHSKERRENALARKEGERVGSEFRIENFRCPPSLASKC